MVTKNVYGIHHKCYWISIQAKLFDLNINNYIQFFKKGGELF